MGAWAVDSFSNDDALDWLSYFMEAPSVDMLRDTLDEVIAEDVYLEAPACSDAIAAAEIIASLNGRPPAKIPDELKDWLTTEHGLDASALCPLALRAIERILAGSELRALRDGGEWEAAWHAEMRDLESRLR